MDLNLLYAQHQRSLMRAHATPCITHRAGHLATARDAAGRIAAHLRLSGAAAACGWNRAAA